MNGYSETLLMNKDMWMNGYFHKKTFQKGHMRQSSAAKFEELKRKDVQASMNNALYKLRNIAPLPDQNRVEAEFDQFERLFGRFLLETGQEIAWDKIRPPPKDTIHPYSDLGTYDSERTLELLNQLVVVKLNGGLGTSMGCTGPKSTICVRNDQSFLDLNIQQIEHLNQLYGADVPLVLMNSFNTDEDIQKLLPLYKQFRVKIYTFCQSRYPRINRSTYLPVPTSFTDPSDEGWYPPGHGDIYESLSASGLLENFLNEGKKYIFISNIDNMGATVDLNILHFLSDASKRTPPEFVMEVTDKTRADVKGGTLVEYENKLRLLEIAQVPKDKVDEFKSVSKFKIFNTNNLWVSVDAVKRVVDERSLHMEIIVNPKTLEDGTSVIQLETAVGAAIKNFEGAIGVNVPRSRFLPVKTSSDLLIIMSNLYSIQKASLVMNPLRSFLSVPLVKLGTHFSKIKEFLKRFADIPDMLELDHLTVSGDVTFGKNVTVKGTVIIIANHGDRIDIPSGAILENKIVSGNLRILDH